MKVGQTERIAQLALFFSSHTQREWLRLDTIYCPVLYVTPKSLQGVPSPSSRRLTIRGKAYRPRIRHAASKRPKPMIQDQVAIGSGIFARPK